MAMIKSQQEMMKDKFATKQYGNILWIENTFSEK